MMGGDTKISDFFMQTAFKFNATEVANNTIEAGMGKFYAESTARSYYKRMRARETQRLSSRLGTEAEGVLLLGGKKGLRSELLRLGIEPDDVVRSKGILNSDQMQRAGQQAVNDSQRFGREAFRNRFTLSPTGQVLFQFKSFAIGATRAIQNETVRQLRVNPARAMRNFAKLGILFPVVGKIFKLAREGVVRPILDAAVGTVFESDKERDSIESILTGFDRTDPINVKLVDGFIWAADQAGLGHSGRVWAEGLASWVADGAYVAGLGIAFDAWTATQFGVEGALKFVAGPTVTSAAELAVGIGTADIDPIAKEGTRRIPFVGPSLPDVNLTGGSRSGGRRGRTGRSGR